MQILQGYEVEHGRLHVPAILHHHGWFDPQKAPMVNYDFSFVCTCSLQCKEGRKEGSRAWWSWKGNGYLFSFPFVLFDVDSSSLLFLFFFCAIDGELDICRCFWELFLAFVWNSSGLSGTFLSSLTFFTKHVFVLLWSTPLHIKWHVDAYIDKHISLSLSLSKDLTKLS